MNICNKTKKPCGGATWMGYCRFTACTMPPEIKREPMFETEDENLMQAEFLIKYIIQKVDADILRQALERLLERIEDLDVRLKKIERKE